MATRRFIEQAPTDARCEPLEKRASGTGRAASAAGAPECTCPPPLACGQRLLLGFASRDTHSRRGRSLGSSTRPQPGSRLPFAYPQAWPHRCRQACAAKSRRRHPPPGGCRGAFAEQACCRQRGPSVRYARNRRQRHSPRTPYPRPESQAAKFSGGSPEKSPAWAGLQNLVAGNSDDRLYPCRLRTLRTLGDFILDALAFLETAKALRIDRRVVHEDIGAAVFRRDESESLGVVEPLHCAVLHDSSNLVMAGGARPDAVGGRSRTPSMQ